MPHSKTKAKAQDQDAFASFFRKSEESPAYWVELAKLEFTEEVVARLKEFGMSKTAFAKALNVQPAMVTRIVSGQNNFELATMVKIARALGCEFRSHLQRPGTQSDWIAFSLKDPEIEKETEEEEQGWGNEHFETTSDRLEIAHIP